MNRVDADGDAIVARDEAMRLSKDPKFLAEMLLIAMQDEKASMVQARWRARGAKREENRRIAAATKLQATVRGKQVRDAHLPEKKVRVLVMRRAARKIQRYARLTVWRSRVKKQCCGPIEKQGQIAVPFFGGMEVVVWKTYYVFLADRQMCWQKLRKKDKQPVRRAAPRLQPSRVCCRATEPAPAAHAPPAPPARAQDPGSTKAIDYREVPQRPVGRARLGRSSDAAPCGCGEGSGRPPPPPPGPCPRSQGCGDAPPHPPALTQRSLPFPDGSPSPGAAPQS